MKDAKDFRAGIAIGMIIGMVTTLICLAILN